MKAHYPEERLALYIEGDLPAREQDEFDAHILGCATCRRKTEELRSNQLLIKSLRGDSVSTSVLLRVRENVLSQMSRTERAPGWRRSIERKLFTGNRLRYAFASAVLIAIAGGSLASLALLRSSGPAPIPRSVAVVPVPGPRAPGSVVPETPKKPATRRREVRQPVAKPAVAEQPVMVNLFTDDPNIVIYWFIDGKVDTE
jgi:anti-sigma factor RsiW